MQINYVTHRAYERGNQAALIDAQRENGYQSNKWMTFVQARSIGRKIKKGARGIVLGYVLDEEDEKTKQKKRSIKRFVVFNYEQTLPANANEYVRTSMQVQS